MKTAAKLASAVALTVLLSTAAEARIKLTTLPERQTVRIQIVPEEPVKDGEQVAIRDLVAAGLLTPPPRRSDVAPVSDTTSNCS